ncbi:hypothetical protein KKF84_10040 [Myxococcota bacterium]|nr:hypothetical protein [Myxococcota bacterium]MBU1535651.1 hypothetical protein [Myxococcota bacterium]
MKIISGLILLVGLFGVGCTDPSPPPRTPAQAATTNPVLSAPPKASVAPGRRLTTPAQPLTRVEIHAEEKVPRARLLRKGQVLLLGEGNDRLGGVHQLYRYQGEGTIRWWRFGPRLEVNGVVVSLDLRELTITQAKRLIKEHRTTVTSVMLEYVPQDWKAMVSLVGQLSTKELVIWLQSRRQGIDSALVGLAPLKNQLRGLLVHQIDLRVTDWLGKLSSFPKLDTVGLYNVKMQEKDLRVLQGMKQLRQLSLLWQRFNRPWEMERSIPMNKVAPSAATSMFKELAVLRSLERLTLWIPVGIGSPLALLDALPRLEDLDLTQNNLLPEASKALSSLRRLQRLVVAQGWGRGTARIGVKDLPLLRSLHLGNIDKEHRPLLKALKHLNQVEILSIASDKISDRDLQFLRGLKNLRALDLMASNQLKGPGYANLTGLSQLRALYLSEVVGEQPVLVHLAKIPQLEILSMRAGYFIKGDMKWLGRMKLLRALGLPTNGNKLEPPAGLANLNRLEWLDLGGVSISGKFDMRWLRGMSRLRVLDLHCDEIDRTHLSALGSLSALEYLELLGDEFDARAGRALKTLSSLRVVKLNGTHAGDEALAGLQFALGLQRLSTPSNITDKGLKNLVGLPKLHWLYINSAKQLTRASGDVLGKMKALRYLTFHQDHLGDSVLQGIIRNRALRSLNLGGLEVTAKGVHMLGVLNNLGNLSFQGNRVKREGIGPLSQLSNLRALEVGYRTLTAGELHSLSGLKRLSYLSSRVDNGAAGVKALSRFKKSLPHCHLVLEL